MIMTEQDTYIEFREMLQKVVDYHERVAKEHTWHLEANEMFNVREMIRDIKELLSRNKS